MAHQPSPMSRISLSVSLSLCMLLGILFVETLQAQSTDKDPEKEKLILELLGQTGQSAEAVGQQMANAFVQQMTAALKNSSTDLPAEAYDIMEQVVTGTIKEEIEENSVITDISYPIYDKYFTVEDLGELIAFNKTPTGKKALALMPQINQEAMLAAQQWGMSLAPKIQERVQKELQEAGIE